MKKNLAILAGVVIVILSYYCYQRLYGKPTIEQLMALAAHEVNKTCPSMVDNATRLDSAVAQLQEKIFRYNYTINMERKDIDTGFVRKKIEPGIVQNVKTNPDMQTFRENKVTIAYNYNDKNGEYIMSIFVTPDEYVVK